MADTLTVFKTLMHKYKVSTSSHRMGDKNPIETPDIDYLFHSKDAHGRVYVNLPLVIVMSEGRFAIHRRHALRNGLPNIQQSAITVYQQFPGEKSNFVLGGTAIMNGNFPLGMYGDDLTLVEKLLAGETIRFHEYDYVDGNSPCIASPTDWIDVKLLQTHD